MSDATTIHPQSRAMAHLIDLFLFRGAPRNGNAAHPVEVLVNHGYVVGFAPSRRQPIWAAYRVAHADQAVDYDRPHLYYADERLEEPSRLDNTTFGTLDDIAYDVGHMVPNEAINTQFGRLAQMETFFMSNMCPQRRSLNRGVWRKLEDGIRNIPDMPRQRDHVWAVVGPVFGESPQRITRSDGKEVDVPEAFYCITVDPFRYPWDRPSNVKVLSLLIPQDAPAGSDPLDYMEPLESIEAKTGLTFMPGWDAEVMERVEAAATVAAIAEPEHRLHSQLRLQA